MFNLPSPSIGSMPLRFQQWRVWSAMWSIRQLRAANPQINKDLFIMYAAENGLNNLMPWMDTANDPVPAIDYLVKLYTPRLKVFYWAKMASLMTDIIDDCWMTLEHRDTDRVLIPNRVYPALSAILNDGGKNATQDTFTFIQSQLKSALASYRISFTSKTTDAYTVLTLDQARRILSATVEQPRFKMRAATFATTSTEGQLGPTDSLQHLANGAELALYLMIGGESKWDVQSMIDSCLAVTGVQPGHEDEELYSECLSEARKAGSVNPNLASTNERVLLWVATLPENLSVLVNPMCDYRIPWAFEGEKSILLSVRSMRRGVFHYIMAARRLREITAARKNNKSEDSKVSMDSAMRIQQTLGYFAPVYKQGTIQPVPQQA